MAASFVTKPRGWSPSRGRAWRRRGECACPSAAEPGERGGGTDLAPAPPPAPSILVWQRDSSPRLPRALVAVLHKLLRPTASRVEDDRIRRSSKPDPARFPGWPKMPVPLRDPFMPRSRSSVPPSPGLPERGPHSGTAEGSRGRANGPRQNPKVCPPPNGSPERVGSGVPGEASGSPVPPRWAERAPEPLSTRVPCLRGRSPTHPGRPAPDSRSAQPPGSAASFSRFGSVPEPYRKTLLSPGS